VQEETPQCIAACPLHVDAKTVCKLMGQRRWDKAWQVIAKTMPLPGIMARLCDAPCKGACVRKNAGGALEMAALEHFCADNAKPVPPPKPLPSRGKAVAVVGGGLTGLCAAWEIARRGFAVTLHCSSPGESLECLVGKTLPEESLERELGSLQTMGVLIKAGVEIDAALLGDLLEVNDAMFVDVEGAGLIDFEVPDELTLGTSQNGLFVSPEGETSPIWQAAIGRRAANSIERYTQGVSMVTGRELEGPYQTRLYTSLENIATVSPVSDANKDELAARDEAKRCIQCECMECVKGCEYLRHYKQYPKVYARQIYNNESIVMGTRQANRMINSCTLCGQCEVICPEDFSMAEVCLEARRTMVDQGKMPPSAHEFAMRDMAFANGDQCRLVRHAPGTGASEYVYFPGCQLTASDPNGVEAAYADLRKRIGNVGLMLQCCSVPAEWAGLQDVMAENVDALKREWQSLGAPKIIAACPTCLKALRDTLPEAEIISYWSVLQVLGLPGGALATTRIMAVNDPCAARHDVMLREDVRSLLDKLGVEATEPEYTGERTQCCGYGGLLSNANPELGHAVVEVRASGAADDFVTYCIMCRDMLAKTGKRTIHIHDLLFPGEGDAAARPAPGYSARRENRVRLKEKLLREVWQEEEGREALPYEAVSVTFTDAARQVMEERRILKSDVQKVLAHVQSSGTYLVNTETGHRLVSFRPVVVTYWVEYEEHENGFIVHNTWCHRMRIKGGQA